MKFRVTSSVFVFLIAFGQLVSCHTQGKLSLLETGLVSGVFRQEKMRQLRNFSLIGTGILVVFSLIS